MVPLHALLGHLQQAFDLSSVPNVSITGVREDSRRVLPGDLFIARGGLQTSGAKFIQDAKDRGAVAVIASEAIADSPLPTVVVPNAGAAASILANIVNGRPSETLRVLAVTGTNGKTTTTYILRHVLNVLRNKCGMIGTVEIDDGAKSVEANMTTPAATDVADLLASMQANGCKACAIETSSHALDQGRIAGVNFAGAAFINLTGDHLDYHKTMEDYAAAKARLFEMLPSHAVAAVNADDHWTPRMVRDCNARIVRFGFGKDADYRARDIAVTATGTNFILHAPDGRVQISLKLVGKHNIENTLAAITLLCEVHGFTIHQVAAALKDAAGAPGRLQPINLGQPFAVLVDYAHTDDALKNVLTALRPLTRGKLRVIFGCGGDRDRTKRPRMAQTAEKLADAVYVTSDNPRTEDARSILDEICTGFSRNAIGKVQVQLDRRSAIQTAVAEAEPGDVILVAGKGHENYQIVGKTKHPFDDVEECLNAIRGKVLAA